MAATAGRMAFKIPAAVDLSIPVPVLVSFSVSPDVFSVSPACPGSPPSVSFSRAASRASFVSSFFLHAPFSSSFARIFSAMASMTASSEAVSFAGSSFCPSACPSAGFSASRAAAASMAICSISSGLLSFTACPNSLKNSPFLFMFPFLSGSFAFFLSESKMAARFPALPRSTTAT